MLIISYLPLIKIFCGFSITLPNSNETCKIARTLIQNVKQSFGMEVVIEVSAHFNDTYLAIGRWWFFKGYR